MTAASVIIDRSARLVGVKASGQPLSAQETADILEALNAMLIRWEADGLAMGFSAVSAATATIPIPTEIEEAVAYNLAVVIAPEFGREPSPFVAFKAREGLAALERDVIKAVPIVLDVPMSESVGVFDINSGT